MKLTVLTPDDVEVVRGWRNECLESLRTNRPLTYAEQVRFYEDCVSNPNSPHRYYGIYEINFIGMGGLTYIDYINKNAEISLIINPAEQGKGYGQAAVGLLLNEGFRRLALENIYGEVYHCNQPGLKFWTAVVKKYHAFHTTLPNRKFWDGLLWDSTYFSINYQDYADVRKENE